ncbi:cyclic nucleotide-gated cation channel beta-1-like [Monodelphis domestica]|uniref:cyclic nucleotide-gated cation channel beta-1-like n=1 Tax=Monodelphis domestica TaxID=13616 RepID=UPI0024E1A038|nr:cyclic nucleotide-gated cation channel beta-1-like [Monodelphis domestica]
MSLARSAAMARAAATTMVLDFQASREQSRCAEMPPQCKSPAVLQEPVEMMPMSDSAHTSLVPVNSASGWVLTLVTKGLQRVVPQPAPALVVQNLESNINVPDQAGPQTLGDIGTPGPGLEPNDKADSQNKRPGKRVIKWLVQGLEKMLPHPPPQLLKISEAGCTGLDEAATEPASAPPEVQPEPQPEEKEPPPEIPTPVPASQRPEEPPTEQESQPVTLPASCLPPSGDRARLIGWVKRRLEMVIPQPVPRGKVLQELETSSLATVQNSKCLAWEPLDWVGL